jgi:hypothetical protein
MQAGFLPESLIGPFMGGAGLGIALDHRGLSGGADPAAS